MDLAALAEAIDNVLDIDAVSLTDHEISQQTLALDALRSKLEAACATRLHQAKRRQIAADHRHRSEATWMAAVTKQNRASLGRRLNQSTELIERFPSLYSALRHGVLRMEHVEAILRLGRRADLRDAAERDQAMFVSWAGLEWPKFRMLLEAWETINDPTDPAQIAEQVHERRSVAVSQGLDDEVLVAMNTTALFWEQAIEATQPIIEEMRAADWQEAKDRVGEDATWHDVLRSESARFHDALFLVIRRGAGVTASGASKVVTRITADMETLMEEAERQHAAHHEQHGDDCCADAEHVEDVDNSAEGVTDEPSAAAASRSLGSLTDEELSARIERFRCHTRSGLRLTPATALMCTLAGDIERLMCSATTRRLEMSERDRLYKGALREALIVRDVFCQSPGCDVRASRCQADHDTRHTDGGRTTDINGAMRCPACHRHKTKLEALGLWPT